MQEKKGKENKKGGEQNGKREWMINMDSILYSLMKEKKNKIALCEEQMQPEPSAEISLPEKPALIAEAEEAEVKANAVTNPGGYENALGEIQMMKNVQVIDGFQLEVNKGLTPFFGINHIFQLGGEAPSYMFASHAVFDGGEKALVARVTHEGMVDAKVMFPFLSERCQVRLNTILGADSQQDTLVLESEFNGDTFNLAGRYIKPASQPLTQLQLFYLQAITKRLCIGGLAAFSKNIPVDQTGTQFRDEQEYGLLVKYDAPSYVFAYQAQGIAAHTLNYVRRVSPNRLSLLSTLDVALQPDMSIGIVSNLGLSLNLKQSKIQSTISSKGVIQTSLEAKIIPNAVNVNLTGSLDHSQQQYKFGYGVQMNLN